MNACSMVSGIVERLSCRISVSNRTAACSSLNTLTPYLLSKCVSSAQKCGLSDSRRWEMASSRVSRSLVRLIVLRRVISCDRTFDLVPRAPNTVTRKVQELVLLEASVAVQVTGVVPMGNKVPDGGVQVVATDAEHASVAVGVKKTVAPVSLVNSTTWFVGQTSNGGVVSTTTTVRMAVPTIPMELLAV